MNYNQFLLTQLLRDVDKTSEYYNQLPYDILWDVSFDILNMYEKIENEKKDLYTDIEDFIKSNYQYLNKLVEEDVN